jgi:hypothetical protein
MTISIVKYATIHYRIVIASVHIVENVTNVSVHCLMQLLEDEKLQQLLDYEKFCSQILEKDPKIRFAAVYDQWAVRAGGGMRKGLESLLSEHMQKELVNLSVIDWEARKDTAKMLGKTKYTMAEYDTIKRFSFYLGDEHMLLVSTEKEADTNVVVDEIIKLYYKNRN